MISFRACGISMFPTIREGDCVFIHPVEEKYIRLGDVLAYCCGDGSVTFAHRLIRIDNDTDKTYYILQGDFNNRGEDALLFKDIIGKVIKLQRDSKTVYIDKGAASALKLIWNAVPILGKVILIILRLPSLFAKLYFFTNPRFYIKTPERSLLTIKEKFNQSEEINFHSQSVNSGLEDWEEEVVQKFIRKPSRILDIGCGAGREAIAWAMQGFEVIGIDISEGMVKMAQENANKRGLNIKFEAKAANGIDFAKGYFDSVIFSRSVYSFIPTKSLRIETLKRIKKCLRPEGYIFLSAYIIPSPFFSGQNIINLLRKSRNLLFPSLFLSEPGDVWLRSVSPASYINKSCFCHFFSSSREILKEIHDAGLTVIDSGIDNVFASSLCKT